MTKTIKNCHFRCRKRKRNSVGLYPGQNLAEVMTTLYDYSTCQIFLQYAAYITDFLQSPWFVQFLVDLWVPRASSWLQMSSSTFAMLTDILDDSWDARYQLFGQRSQLHHAVRLSKLSSPLLDQTLDGNSFSSFRETHFSLFSSFQLRFYHINLFYQLYGTHAASLR